MLIRWERMYYSDVEYNEECLKIRPILSVDYFILD